MKDLYTIANECLQELDNIGIEYGTIKEFRINKRAKSFYGQCIKKPEGFIIEIITDMLADDVPDIELKDTIIHEILHTCENCFNHGKPWKNVADKVNKAYGYNISRLANFEIKTETKPKVIKYRLHCVGCGQTYERTKKSRFTENPQYYRCGECHGEIVRDF